MIFLFIEVCFSPQDGCTEKIVDQVNAAKSEILVQAYSFTSAPIAKALLKAYKRGVKVEAILDKSQRKEKYTRKSILANKRCQSWQVIWRKISESK
jgi:phosphatidylserine/phosphatidylglycerophosphate/cardiolipin synthase-like enzyme